MSDVLGALHRVERIAITYDRWTRAAETLRVVGLSSGYSLQDFHGIAWTMYVKLRCETPSGWTEWRVRHSV